MLRPDVAAEVAEARAGGKGGRPCSQDRFSPSPSFGEHARLPFLAATACVKNWIASTFRCPTHDRACVLRLPHQVRPRRVTAAARISPACAVAARPVPCRNGSPCAPVGAQDEHARAERSAGVRPGRCRRRRVEDARERFHRARRQRAPSLIVAAVGSRADFRPGRPAWYERVLANANEPAGAHVRRIAVRLVGRVRARPRHETARRASSGGSMWPRLRHFIRSERTCPCPLLRRVTRACRPWRTRHRASVYRQRAPKAEPCGCGRPHRRSVHARSAESARRGGAFRALSPDGENLVSAAQDKGRKIWSRRRDGKFLSTLSGHTAAELRGLPAGSGWRHISRRTTRRLRGGTSIGPPTRSTLTTFSPVSVAEFHPEKASPIATAGDDDARAGVRTCSTEEARAGARAASTATRSTSVSFHTVDAELSAHGERGQHGEGCRARASLRTLNGHRRRRDLLARTRPAGRFSAGGADAAVMVWKTNFDRALGDGYSPGARGEGEARAPRRLGRFPAPADESSGDAARRRPCRRPSPPRRRSRRGRANRRRRTTRAAHPRHRRRRRRSPRCPRRARPCALVRPRALSLRRQGRARLADARGAGVDAVAPRIGQLDALTTDHGFARGAAHHERGQDQQGGADHRRGGGGGGGVMRPMGIHQPA